MPRTKKTSNPRVGGTEVGGKRNSGARKRTAANGRTPARPKSTVDPSQGSPRWTFFTNHAHVLICLYQDSEAILRDIAGRVGITERAVQRIVQELEEAGFVERERVGRRNRYKVIRNKSLRHPIEEHCSVDELFAVILERN